MIFDIGKTNKKAFLFNESYQIVWERSENLPEITDEDGDPCENLAALTGWVLAVHAEAGHHASYTIKAINFSTYGASFVHLDAVGNPLTPLYNYLKPFPEVLKKQFYTKYDGEEKFAEITASPVLGNLNSGMQLYRLKYEAPEIFSRIQASLHLPQYLHFLLTKRTATDLTSIGCHTNLWDFTRQNYHAWVEKEGISEKLPPIRPQFYENESINESISKLPIGTGLHDSSSALIPYLMCFNEPFVLLSTGTWNISLHPFNETPLTADELRADCLCYLTYQGKPVKASRLFAGYEHEQGVQKLAKKWKIAEDAYKNVDFDATLLDSKLESYEADYHRLIQEIVSAQIHSTDLILHNAPVSRLFVDGGFSHNPIFMNLLANAYPQMEIYAAEVAQASALGAALVLHDVWNAQPLPERLISLSSFS